MDLASVLADKALLASLSREYELLKTTNADVDWHEWITARLKRAAARRASSSSSTHGALGAQKNKAQPNPYIRQQSVSLRTPSKAPARQAVSRTVASSRRSSAADEDAQAAPQSCRDWQAQDVTNHWQQAVQQAGPLIQMHSNPGPIQGPQVGQSLPQSLPGPHTGPQPHWVAAARLGSALQSSRAVPSMHAAADRERRLAAAAAVARQQLDLGLDPAATAALAAAAAAGGGEQQLPPAAQAQLQQMAQLTHGVVEQNQLLQQAMAQQQAQLSQQQGLLSTVLQQAGRPADTAGQPGPVLAPAPSSLPGQLQQKQQQPAAAASASTAAAAAAATTAAVAVNSVPNQMADLVKGSWLVKSLLQHQQGQPASSTSNQGTAGAPACAPDFIRIAGAAKQQPQRAAQPQTAQQQAQPLSPQDGAPGAAAAAAAGGAAGPSGAAVDRRRQLKSVLRQLLTEGAVGPLPGGLAGLMEGLKGLQAAGDGADEQNQPGSRPGTHSQAAAASLVALLKQQQQQADGKQQTRLSKAQLLVLQRRKAQEEARQRQQQEEQEARDSGGGGGGGSSRPGWQSEVYVPPPSRMLRVQRGAAADVWNALNSSPGNARPQPSKPASKAQPQRRKPGQRSAAGARAKPAAGRRGSAGGSGSSRRSLAGVLYGSGWRVDGGLRQQQQQQLGGSLGAWGTGDQAGVEHTRLARVEETTAQVLEAVARLEQRVQQQQQPRAAPHQRDTAVHDSAEGPMQLQQQDPAALASLLTALERVEQQEREIRDRWFGANGSGSGGGGSSGVSRSSSRAGEVAGGHVPGAGVMACGGEDDNAEGDRNAARECLKLRPAHAQQLQKQQQEEEEEAAQLAQPAQQQPASTTLQQQQQQQQSGALSAAAIRSIKSSRRRFLRHQAWLDGTLQELGSSGAQPAGLQGSGDPQNPGRGEGGGRAGSGVLQPDQVVAAVADLLLEELIGEEAAGLEGFCDALCDQLVEAEFEEA